jgi:hypothetical protein
MRWRRAYDQGRDVSDWYSLLRDLHDHLWRIASPEVQELSDELGKIDGWIGNVGRYELEGRILHLCEAGKLAIKQWSKTVDLHLALGALAALADFRTFQGRVHNLVLDSFNADAERRIRIKANGIMSEVLSLLHRLQDIEEARLLPSPESKGIAVIEYCDLATAASWAGVTKRRVYAWIKEHPGAPLPKIEGGGGKKSEYDWAELRPFLENHCRRKLPLRLPRRAK